VFFVVMLVVYVISKLFIKEEAAGPSAEESLLTEIRDELRNRPV
jgi:large-conductance mechanosensitive channel